MKLRKLQIKNFRGIKDLELDLDDLVVLIGENNIGKTAIFQALRLCLQTRRVFAPYDFHLKDENAEPTCADPISITITFAEDKSGDWDSVMRGPLRKIFYVDGSGKRVVVLKVSCSYELTEQKFAETSTDFLNERGQPLLGPNEAHVRLLRREVAFFLLDALRDAGRNFDAKGPFWRPFLKGSQLPAEKKAEIESTLKTVNDLVVTSHGSFEKVRKRLKEVQGVVPMQAGDVVSIEAVPGRMFDMLNKAQVYLGTTTGAKVPVGLHGEGTQSLAVLMLFAAFLDLKAAAAGKIRAPVVALEEPEAHLHPSAVRTLWKTIKGIPGQKLISTHSGDLLSQVPVSAVRRLARGVDGVEVFRLKPETLNDKETRMLDFHIRHARGELLFARCWLLVEGETEITLIQGIARQLDLDLERSGVRCVQYRLGASIELFLKVATDFGIRWCVLADNDQQGQADQNHVKRHTKASMQEEDVLHVMPEDDIEQHLCKAGFGSVYQAIYDEHPKLHSPPEATPACTECGKGGKPRPRVTVPSSHPTYWSQLLKVIKNVMKKPAAALEVIEMIKKGTPVPSLLETAIRKSVELAGDV